MPSYNPDVFEDGKFVYANTLYAKKSYKKIEKTVNRNAWLRTYEDPRYINDSRILQRSWSRLNSSSYISDFVIGNIGSIGRVIIIFMLMITLSQLLTLTDDDISKLNPFESGISLLQSISNAGANAKFNFMNFLNSFSVITADELPKISIFGVDIAFSPIFGRVISVIVSFVSSIIGFVIYIGRVIIMIVRLFLGLY